MKLPTRVRYATRIMLDLAISNGSGRVLSRDIAARQGISKSYLDNLTSALKAAGLVNTKRGAGGGLVLNKPLSQIKVSDIWVAMEGPVCLIDCIHQTDSCPRYDRCITREIWQEAEQALNVVFQSWTLEDLKRKSKLYQPRNIIAVTCPPKRRSPLLLTSS